MTLEFNCEMFHGIGRTLCFVNLEESYKNRKGDQSKLDTFLLIASHYSRYQINLQILGMDGFPRLTANWKTLSDFFLSGFNLIMNILF